MKEQEFYELLGEIDPAIIADADRPIPFRQKRGFKLMLIAAVLAFVLLLTPVAGAFAVAGTYKATHPEFDGNYIQALDQALGLQDVEFSGLLTEQLLDVDWDALRNTVSADGNVNWNEFFAILRGKQQQEVLTDSAFRAVELDDGSVMITKYTGQEEILIVPDTILGKKVTVIGEYAFAENQTVVSAALPATVTKISAYAFYGCTALTSVIVPHGLQEIGDSAFANCQSLRSLTQPIAIGSSDIPSDAIAVLGINLPQSVHTLGDHAFDSCVNLRSIMIRSTLQNWGEAAFYGSGLQNVGISDSVKEIPDYAFYGCAELQEIIVPSSVTRIGQQAFGLCSSLQTVSLNDGLEYIGLNAFEGTAIQSLTVPATVTVMEGIDFPLCQSLEQVIFRGDAPQVIDPVYEFINPPLPDYTVYYSLGSKGFDGETWQDRECVLMPCVTQPYVSQSGLEVVPFYRETLIGTSGSSYFPQDAVIINTYKQYKAVRDMLPTEYEDHLTFDPEYFENFSIVLIKVTHSSSEQILGMAGLGRLHNGSLLPHDLLYPVIIMDSPQAQTDDLQFTYIAVEIGIVDDDFGDIRVLAYNLNPDNHGGGSTHHSSISKEFSLRE